MYIVHNTYPLEQFGIMTLINRLLWNIYALLYASCTTRVIIPIQCTVYTYTGRRQRIMKRVLYTLYIAQSVGGFKISFSRSYRAHFLK